MSIEKKRVFLTFDQKFCCNLWLSKYFKYEKKLCLLIVLENSTLKSMGFHLFLN